MWRDVRHALRALVRVPGFAAAATCAIALAVGVNGAMFGLVDALWFRPPAVRDPGTIVRVFATGPGEQEGPWSWPEFQDIRARGALEEVAVRGRRGAILTGADGAEELLLVNVVSTNFFEMMGISPAAGRLFAPGDERSLDASPGVVLGHAFWRTRFGGDPQVVGRLLQLGRGQTAAVTVLGVLPAGFRDLEASADRDLWLPPQTWVRIGGSESEFRDRDYRWFEMVARRRAGTAAASAGAEIDALTATFAAEYGAGSAGRGARLVDDLQHRLERGGVAAKALLCLVMLVVLITCVNVATLLLARTAARGQELALRLALGADRWRLVRHLAAESLVLGALGALGGLIVAAWLIRLLPALMTPPPGMRSFLLFQTDGRVLLFTAVVAFATTVLFGLAPALSAARADILSAVKASAGGAERRGFFVRALVIGQVAVSLVMLGTAAALARSFVETQRGDIGFARKPLLTLWTTFGGDNAVTAQEAARQLAALPGVTSVAAAIRAPLSLSGGGLARPVLVPGAPLDHAAGFPQVKFNAVSSNYFETMGTRIIRGRTFSEEEQRGGPGAALVNEQFVRQFAGGRDVLHTVIDISGVPHRIVGITQDGVVNEVGERPQAYMYLPFWAGSYGETTFVLETRGDAAALASAARATLRRVDSGLEPRRTVTMAQYVEYATSLHRTTAALAGILGLVGLVLTAIGVYGVVSSRTTRRTREIGIRMALGALEPQILRLVMRDGLALGLTGVIAGLPIVVGATHLLGSMLVGIDPWDARSFAVAAVVLLAAVLLATAIPALRAIRIEPSRALRT